MSKTSKKIALILVIVIAGFLLKNIFSGPGKKSIDSETYYYKLEPINFPKKQFPEIVQDSNDPAIQLARKWKLPELYNRMSEACLELFADQHPNNLVQKDNLTSLYGVEIGISDWFELTSTYEQYATDACYYISGREVENLYAESYKEKLADEDVSELLSFFNTELGKKYISSSEYANSNVQKYITQKQRDASNKGLETYNNKIKELQQRTL